MDHERATNMALRILLVIGATLAWSSEKRDTQLEDITPQKVRFHSLDFRNVLQWKPHTNSSSGLKYYVQWKIYGVKQWTNVTHCQGTNLTSCDLSYETSDPREWYYARVHASLTGIRSLWANTPRFHPRLETTFSAPVMRLDVSKQGIMVRVKPHRLPNRRRSDAWTSAKKLQGLSYRIYLIHSGIEKETHDIKGCNRHLLITGLSPRTTYCFQAKTYIQLQGPRSPRSPKTCVTTP